MYESQTDGNFHRWDAIGLNPHLHCKLPVIFTKDIPILNCWIFDMFKSKKTFFFCLFLCNKLIYHLDFPSDRTNHVKSRPRSNRQEKANLQYLLQSPKATLLPKLNGKKHPGMALSSHACSKTLSTEYASKSS